MVGKFNQLENYDQLIHRVLELTLAGNRTPQVARIVEQEGFHSPRSKTPISAMMVQKLLLEHSDCRRRLTNPTLEPHHWRSGTLAEKLGIPEKKLKDWVTRGWVRAIQRPFGRVWVILADEQEICRLQRLICSQKGQGSPLPSIEGQQSSHFQYSARDVLRSLTRSSKTIPAIPVVQALKGVWIDLEHNP